MKLSIHFVKFCALRLDEQCLSSGVVISDGSRGVSMVSTVSIETPFSEENLATHSRVLDQRLNCFSHMGGLVDHSVF